MKEIEPLSVAAEHETLVAPSSRTVLGLGEGALRITCPNCGFEQDLPPPTQKDNETVSSSIDQNRRLTVRQKILSFAATKQEHQVRIDAYTQFGQIASDAAAKNVPFEDAALNFVAKSDCQE